MPQLPPGPQSRTLNAIRWLRDPLGFSEACQRRYGDPFTTRFWTFGTLVATTTPEGIRQIYTAHPDTFESNAALGAGPLLGDHSIFLMDGARHKRQRALLMPAFHHARMQTYGPLMQEVALRHAGAWQPGQTFRMYDTTQAISLEVIIQAIFGIQRPERVKLFEETIRSYFRAFTPLLAFFTITRRAFGGIGPWSQFTRARARFEQLMAEEIGARRQGPGEREDILSLLLAAGHEDGRAMTDAELKDELKSLLFAGHETVAIAMAWGFYWLHRQPEIYERLEAELAPLGRAPRPKDLVQLPYLGAVCDEALRLYPSVPGVGRTLKRTLTLRGYELPPGVGVFPSILAAHMDPTLYPEPTHFRPERFLERKYTPFEYLPFGGGARRCVGAAFASYEMKIVLGSILAQHRLALTEEKPVTRTFTHAPQGGVKMICLGPVNR